MARIQYGSSGARACCHSSLGGRLINERRWRRDDRARTRTYGPTPLHSVSNRQNEEDLLDEKPTHFSVTTRAAGCVAVPAARKCPFGFRFVGYLVRSTKRIAGRNARAGRIRERVPNIVARRVRQTDFRFCRGNNRNRTKHA